MARAKIEVAQRAARHGLAAHVLYMTSVQVLDAAEGLDVINEPLAGELREIAKRLDNRRRAEMRKTKA